MRRQPLPGRGALCVADHGAPTVAIAIAVCISRTVAQPEALVRLSRTSCIASLVYLVLGLLWVALAHPPGRWWLEVGWVAVVALAGMIVPGLANQVSLARGSPAAPALGYGGAPAARGLL